MSNGLEQKITNDSFIMKVAKKKLCECHNFCGDDERVKQGTHVCESGKIFPENAQGLNYTQQLESKLTAEREARQRAEAALKESCDEHRADCLYELGISCAGTEELQRENAELNRKLAEQQSHNNFDAARLRRLCAFCGVAAPDSDEELLQVAGVVIGSCLRNLTKLIEEAKRQAVPEGMIALPATCQECGTKDIEYTRMCHNSKCKGYAMEFSVYEGWRAAPQPERKD